jgi:hypothetical protein
LTREVSEEAELVVEADSDDGAWEKVNERIESGEEFDELSWSGYDVDKQSLEVMHVEATGNR